MNGTNSEQAAKPFMSEFEEARRTPGGYVYRIAGQFGPNDAIPPTAIVGAWRVDEFGAIVGAFIPNPNYKPAD